MNGKKLMGWLLTMSLGPAVLAQDVPAAKSSPSPMASDGKAERSSVLKDEKSGGKTKRVAGRPIRVAQANPEVPTDNPPPQPPAGMEGPRGRPEGDRGRGPNPGPEGMMPGTEADPNRPPEQQPPQPVEEQPPMPPPVEEPPPPPDQEPPQSINAGASAPAQMPKPAKPKAEGKEASGADAVPPGQELVNIDFPEPTEIKDIIRAVALWTGKNVILGKGVSGKVQMISPRNVTKEEAYQAFLSALNVVGLTTVETGKIIKIMPSRTALRGNLQIYQGSTWAPKTDKMITQIVPLKYIDAKQIQTTLSRLVSPNSMIVYQPTNTLIISDTGYKVARILQIIEIMDVKGQQPKVAFVPIRYGDAKTISQKIGEIMKASGSDTTNKFRSYKITIDERSNSVIVFGPPQTINDVTALIKKFDFPIDDPANQSAIRVRFLDYADAKKLATTLSSLAQGGNSSGASRTIGSRVTTKSAAGVAAGSEPAPVADLGNNLKITSDESSNSLLITGSRSAYEAVNSIIRKLDQARPQVYVEADIIDVSMDNGFQFGTSWLLGAGKDKGGKTAITWQGERIQPSLVGQRANATDIDKVKALTPFANDSMTVGVISGASFDVPGLGKISPLGIINMLKEDGNNRVLSSPHLLTSNNETAKITVGEKVFYKTAVQSTIAGGGAIDKIESEKVDLKLEIKPNISQTGNYITLKLDLQADEVAPGIPGAPLGVNTRASSQIVTVRNGQTAVISGLVKTREKESFKKIPLLGDIPILGWLFRNSDIKKTTSSLMIFLTPHVVFGANDLAAIYEKKVTERDALMAKAFGVEKDDDFMQMLPQLEDGKFKADNFDIKEMERREKLQREIRQDMGYEDAPVSARATPESSTTVPAIPIEDAGGTSVMDLNVPEPTDGGGGGGEGGVSPNPPQPGPPSDMPAGEDIPPPEPPPQPEPMDGG